MAVMQPPTFSWTIFITLGVVFGASLTTFLLLVRRWTTQRQWVSLSEWASQRDFEFRANQAELPRALHKIAAGHVEVRLHLCSEDGVTLVQLQTDPPPGKVDPNRWNVLVRRARHRNADVAALRPANAPASLLDLFGLSQFPSLAIAHRFIVLATTSSAARLLSDSASRTLLPADIGLLSVDDWLVLDFSTRPFDPIELDRMLALAAQLSQML
jgi:hypothetical protein